MKSDLVDLDLMLLDDSRPLAIRVDDGVRRVWLPRSQIEIQTDVEPRRITVTMPVWLAREKGLV